MLIKGACFVIFLIFVTVVGENSNSNYVGNSLAYARPCKGNNKALLSYELGRPLGQENQYSVFISENLIESSYINVEFNEDATITLNDPSYANIRSLPDNGFTINFSKDGPSNGVGFKVRGRQPSTVPYIISLNINGRENCDMPNLGVLDDYIPSRIDTVDRLADPPLKTCGRKIIRHTELITHGTPTKPGDWPWHVALYRFESNALKYKCGGTLISKSAVLTAAHCTTIRGVPLLPEVMSVVLGKHNLFGGDIGAQEREVFRVIVHKDYNTSFLHNDISILKLKTEAIFNEYVQPACIWDSSTYKKIPKGQIHGTVVGWGYDQRDLLSTALKQATVPKVSDENCLKSNPVFFASLLNEFKFCAGLKNGTSACNGDSGGGFFIFVPETADDLSKDPPGSWYVRGIVSIGVSRADANICDPSEYILFTDIAKYEQWIQQYMS